MHSSFIPCISLPTWWGYAGILVFVLSLTACQSGEISLTRFEDSPVIDSLLASAPHFVANTDIEAERWIATTSLGHPTDSLILGSPWLMIAIGDSVYVSEQTGIIFAIGADRYLSRKIGNSGKGPGEFEFLDGLQYNGSHIFVLEVGRVQVLTDKFEYVGSFLSSTLLQGRFSVSPDYVFMKCRGNDWLVCARSTSAPYNWIPSINLLPVLSLPDRSGENFHEVTISPDGDRIAVAYSGLPYIFIYDDDFRHLRTIRFAGSEVHNFKPVGLPNGAPAGMEPGSFSFIAQMKFINSRFLIVRAPIYDHYVFDLSEYDYNLARKIIFHPPDDMKSISTMDFLLHGDHLYVSSQWEEYVYGFKFDLE
ncbi:MAG: hypothetical protein OXE59_13045 [Bacteroidetes bacterium]|nr:hypothetical protein [Bacteroidota bacterium]